MTSILVVEDTKALAKVYEGYLRREPYELEFVETVTGAKKALVESIYEGVLLDLRLPDGDGLDILKWMNDKSLASAVVVMTAEGSLTRAVDAMKLGASDFIVKPFAADRLVYTVRNALERKKLIREVETIRHEYDRGEFAGFIGRSLV